MKILSNFIKYTLTFLIIFFLCFMWIEYVKRTFSLSLTLSLLISFLLTILLYYIERKKENKKYSTRLEQQKMDMFGRNLLVSSTIQQEQILQPLKQANATYCTLFHKQVITTDDVLPFIKDHANENVVLFCYEYSKDVKDFLKHVPYCNLTILNYSQIYSMLRSAGAVKDVPNLWQEEKHASLKIILASALKKEKAKSYFYSALLLSLGSLFLRYNIYYILVSSFLFLLSLYALCNKRYNEKR